MRLACRRRDGDSPAQRMPSVMHCLSDLTKSARQPLGHLTSNRLVAARKLGQPSRTISPDIWSWQHCWKHVTHLVSLTKACRCLIRFLKTNLVRLEPYEYCEQSCMAGG